MNACTTLSHLASCIYMEFAQQAGVYKGTLHHTSYYHWTVSNQRKTILFRLRQGRILVGRAPDWNTGVCGFESHPGKLGDMLYSGCAFVLPNFFACDLKFSLTPCALCQCAKRGKKFHSLIKMPHLYTLPKGTVCTCTCMIVSLNRWYIVDWVPPYTLVIASQLRTCTHKHLCLHK